MDWTVELLSISKTLRFENEESQMNYCFKQWQYASISEFPISFFDGDMASAHKNKNNLIKLLIA